MLTPLLSLANDDWVITIDSWNPWPTIGIVAITHGNEIAWLIACDRLLHEFSLWEKLKKGKVLLILNNIEASKRNTRFIDRDMNRLWNEAGSGYEYERRKVIEPYILTCDHILDLHSTTAPSTPMVINSWDNPLCNDVIWHLSVEYRIHNIMRYILGESLISFHRKHFPHNCAIVIECGSHLDASAGSIAYENACRFLSYFWSVEYYYSHTSWVNLDVIDVYQAPWIGNLEYCYSDAPKSFDILEPHTLVARFQEEEIHSPDEETLILMPTPFSSYVWDSVMYFAEQRDIA